MPKYSPLINTIVSVRLPDIEAESQEDAAKKALETFEGYDIFDHMAIPPGVVNIGWAEDNVSVLIDEVGDENLEKSRWFDKNGIPL